jgi:phenylalanine-4-hydroxylase
MVPERRLSLLIQLRDTPGALQRALQPFNRHGVNLTHIESRPARGECFDFYLDCEALRGETSIEAAIAEIEAMAVKLLVLDHRSVPWFPRQISELDLIANNTLDAGDELQADHPGFRDSAPQGLHRRPGAQFPSR